MKKRFLILCAALAVLVLCGCQMRTVDQMYVPPERSEDYNSLQSAIASAMTGMEYCAPVSGENQQIVQMADLDGDDVEECLLYAKDGSESPLHILIFTQINEAYIHTETLNLMGAAFEKVEYAQIDGEPGVEIIVGTQVSDQLSRSVSVFSFSTGAAVQLATADYRNFLMVDLNANGKCELFVLRAGPTESDRGIVELYSVRNGVFERSVEVRMSETVDNLKRILTGQLYGGKPAVYIASAVDENTLITDVFALVDGVFTNVSLSNDSGTSIKTMRNYFVYADDIDSDGVMELPSLTPMRPIDTSRQINGNNLIRWYSMTDRGEEVDKLYTYHSFLGGWYMQLDSELAPSLSVVDQGSVCDFYVWEGESPVKVMTVSALTGQNREEYSTTENRFVLYKAESAIYVARLEQAAENYDLTQETVVRSFHLIREHWKTGEM